MSISFDIFTSSFIGKITDRSLLSVDEYDRVTIVDDYLKRSCAQFNPVCKYDLTDRDDELRIFNFDVADNEIDELSDIISEGMVIQWLRPQVYKLENLENVLSTKDFTMYSNAELLYRITNMYNMAKNDYKQMVREYSYNHGDLEVLHL